MLSSLVNPKNELTSSESRKIINEELWASGMTDPIEICSSKLLSLDPFQDIDPMVRSNTEVSVNLSALCRMDLESECIASNFDDEEDDGDEIWERDGGDEREEHLMFLKTLWMTIRGNM